MRARRTVGLVSLLAGLGLVLSGPAAEAMLPTIDSSPPAPVRKAATSKASTSRASSPSLRIAEGPADDAGSSSTSAKRTTTKNTSPQVMTAAQARKIVGPAHRAPVAKQVAKRSRHKRTNLLVTPYGAERLHLVGTRHGRMAVPGGVHDVGLWNRSARPRARGVSFVAGHVTSMPGDNGVGAAALYELHKVHRGQKVRIRWNGRWSTFRVTAKRRVRHFPRNLLAPTRKRIVVLTTCAGPLVKRSDGRYHWSTHLLVRARLVR